MNPEIIKADVDGLTDRVYQDITAGNKAAAAGSLFQLSPSTSLYWKQHPDVSDTEIRERHETLMDVVSQIMDMDGAMDGADMFILTEALDHVRMSFEERGYDDLLNQLIKANPATKEPKPAKNTPQAPPLTRL